MYFLSVTQSGDSQLVESRITETTNFYGLGERKITIHKTCVSCSSFM